MEDIPRDSEPDLNFSVVIGLLEVDLRLPLCRSLKTKRGIVARILNHLRKQHPLSAAEVGSLQAWSRAGLAAVTVSNDRAVAERNLRGAIRMLQTDRDVELVDYSMQML